MQFFYTHLNLVQVKYSTNVIKDKLTQGHAELACRNGYQWFHHQCDSETSSKSPKTWHKKTSLTNIILLQNVSSAAKKPAKKN